MPTAEDLRVTPNSYVQLIDAGGDAYVSPSPSDDNGDWMVQVPPGTYQGSSGPTPQGPWTAEARLANYVVAYDQDAADDLTPAGAVFPGNGAGAQQKLVGLTAGSGAPNNAVGQDGWLYFRQDGGAGTTIYQRRSGSWVGIV